MGTGRLFAAVVCLACATPAAARYHSKITSRSEDLDSKRPDLVADPGQHTWLQQGADEPDTDENTSRLQIVIPSNLFKRGGYRHKEALFGIPVFGGFIAEKLYYENSTKLCEPPTADVVSKWQTPFILLVDRGDCTFVTKVRHAQHLGASGVLVADGTCLCDDTTCERGSGETCQFVEPIMADDGSGADITIPSFLLYKPEADAIKAELSKGTSVQAEMTWSLPTPDDRVEWLLWTSANDSSSYALKDDFYDVIKALGKHQYFTPFYQIYDGASYSCKEMPEHCGNLCTNQGSYCMPDPDRDPYSGYSGADLIAESLRQKCIWKHYGGDMVQDKEQEGVGLPWWKYVTDFYKQCSIQAKFNDPACITAIMKDAGIDSKLIDGCIKESGGLESETNAILASEVQEKAKKSIVIVPSVYVNNVVQRGAMTATNVLSSICAGYASGTQPKVCNCVGANPEQVMGCVKSGNYEAGPVSPVAPVTQGVPWAGVLGIVVAVVLVMTAAGFIYWKRTQEQMREQVRSILAEYMPLEDTGDGDLDGFSHGRPNGRYYDLHATRDAAGNTSVQV